ncbi:hypothetical protein [Methylobacterium mesophilicum]|uniref:hypothetical protein n=1 Tax=Methylobacterium mesophilicum TaxID=39956 RepID=UPI001EE19527|nr:hypothetical protein [Methylobacterium mesophilicum]GJE25039.1 hypothetical protein JHFBIEKO_5518 [Methylobacterium mesophilicum]
MTDRDPDAHSIPDSDPQAARMPEVLRLSTALAEQMLASQITGRSISGDQLAALVGAARLLQDSNVPWPPLVHEVVQELADRMDAAGPQSDGAA